MGSARHTPSPMCPTARQPALTAAAIPETASAQSAAAPLMRRLRAHTAPVHAATEALPLMRRVLTAHPTAAGYRGYLAALHRVYLDVEPALYAVVPASLLDALGVAPKLPALHQDLLALADAAPGAGPPLPTRGDGTAMRRLLDHPDRPRIATALGGLYVLEGATLGGQVIARHLRAHWPAGQALPTGFLERRRSHPGGWRDFGAALERWAARHPGSDHAILDGALGVFSLMHAALATAEPPEPDAS